MYLRRHAGGKWIHKSHLVRLCFSQIKCSSCLKKNKQIYLFPELLLQYVIPSCTWIILKSNAYRSRSSVHLNTKIHTVVKTMHASIY